MPGLRPSLTPFSLVMANPAAIRRTTHFRFELRHTRQNIRQQSTGLAVEIDAIFQAHEIDFALDQELVPAGPIHP